jgi:ABC-type protease/lipase transport system fused ATPase/permease subunit
VLLDEPAANLDAEGEEAVRRVIAHARASKATVIVVSHQLSVLQGLDTFMLMQRGTIGRYGPRDEVLRDLQAARTKQGTAKAPTPARAVTQGAPKPASGSPPAQHVQPVRAEA